MPTLLRYQGWRFHFVAGDRGEPPHVHIVKGQKGIKLWLRGDHVELSANLGVNRRDLSRLTRIAEDNQQRFLEVWNDFFGS